MTEVARLSVEVGTEGYEKGTAAANRFADANKRVATEAEKVTATTTRQTNASKQSAEAIEKEAERLRKLDAFMAGHNVTAQQVIETTGGMSAKMIGFWAVIAIGIAAFRDLDKEAAAASRAIAVSGNIAGTTRGEMHALAVEMANVGTISVGVAKDVVTAMVASGRISSAALGEVGMLAETLAFNTGKKIKEITPDLIRVFADPAKGAAELNKTLHALDPAFLRYIEQLQRSGQYGEAQLQLANKLNEVMPKAKDHLGLLETAWRAVGAAASSAWDKILGVGRPKTLEEQVTEAVENVKELERRGRRVNPRKLDAAREYAAQLTNDLDDRQTGQRAQSGAAAANQLANDAAELVKQHSTLQKIQNIDADIAKIRAAGVASGGLDKEQQETINKLLKDRAGILRAVGAEARAIRDAQIEGELKLEQLKSKGAQEELDHRVRMGRMTKAEAEQQKLNLDLAEIKRRQEANAQKIAGGGLTQEQTSRLIAENAILAEQATQRRAKADREAAQEIENYARAQAEADAQSQQRENTARMSAIEGYNTQIEAMKRHNEQLGKTKEQVDLLKAAEIDRKIIALELAIVSEYNDERDANATAARVAGLEREIAKLRELKGLMKDSAAIEKAIETSKAWQTAAKNMQNAMSTFFFDVLQGNMSQLGSNFKKMVDRMLADAIAAQATLALFGDKFSTGGGAGGLIGAGIAAAKAFFAPSVTVGGLDGAMGDSMANYNKAMGFRAAGGSVSAGSPYVVGELGPEVFVPSSPGTVVPNSGLTPNVQVNVINKADPVSVKQSPPRFDSGQMVIDLVLQRLSTDANARDGFRSALGPAS